MKTEETLLHENARAEQYKFLSECYHAPDEKLIEMLCSRKDSVQDLLKNIPTIDDLEQLKIEYSRLFLGPFKVLVPPYGSVYLEHERRVMGESTIDVKRWYEKEKLDILIREVPDHIAIELEFMYLLVFKQIEATKDSDSVGAWNYQKKQASFLNTHLGKWAPEFSEKLEASARNGFYKNLARYTRLFVEEDAKGLSTL
ncbi:MAG: molecular chaperone TorD family protein [Candidatus Omnitrophica bacterium]|nr:molecular chaperone TorD family protein [Candidatus Omnitrophota bacterium]MBU4590377.1 molecular chaperone TorD family protein [Candidatus Omnitrophota bacterium]